MLDTLAALRILLSVQPNLNLGLAFDTVDRLNASLLPVQPLTLDTVARTSIKVLTEIRGDRKIQAIKELRLAGTDALGRGTVGLKEAKDVVDNIWNEYAPAWSTYRR